MAEYIEREALERSLNERVESLRRMYGNYDAFTDGFDECIGRVEEFPAADVAPVRHGRWDECDWVKYDGHGECIHYPKAAWRCSNCCNAFKKELLWKDNYCPNCGAKMDLEGGDGNG